MELSEAVRRRRMTRNFTGRPVDPALLDGLLADALRAPSAGNTQACELVVLTGPSETARYWDTTTDEAWRARSERYEGLSRAPVVVLPFVDPDAYAARYRQPDKVRPDLLTELRDMFSLVRGSPVVRGWVMVPAHGHCQRRRTPGSRFVDGAVGGIGGPDRRPLRALSAA